ncbi:MAG: hypothetical protein ACOC88_04115 [Candidatus Bipolaricaulota bacterium]
MKLERNRSFSLLVLSLTVLFSSVLVAAQTAPPLVLNPMNDHFQLPPGSSYEDSFVITNEGAEARTVEINLVSFTLTEGGSFKALTEEDKSKYDLSEYVTYTPRAVEIGAGDTAEIRYSVELPPDVSGIPRWAALIVSSDEATETTQQGGESMSFQINLNFSYVFALFQHSASPGNVTGQLDQITTEYEQGDARNTLTVSVPFTNNSDVIAEATTYIEVRNDAGEKVLRHDFSADKLILPEGKRVFSHTFTDPELESGQYLVLGVVDYGGSNNLAGQALLQVP